MTRRFQHLQLHRPLVVIDLETTGCDPATDRIIELAAVRYTPEGQRFKLHTLVNPGIPIPAAATEVHGLRDADVAGSPPFGAVAPRLLRFVGAVDLAGFNIRTFDLQFLLAEFHRCGQRLPLAGRAVLDPMGIFHDREPRDLAAAVRFYCGRDHDEAHTALADALAAAEVLDAQLDRYRDLPRTPAELHRRLTPVDLAGRFRFEDGSVVFAFGRYRGRPLEEVADTDPDYLRWMLGQDFLDDVKELVASILNTVSPAAGRH